MRKTNLCSRKAAWAVMSAAVLALTVHALPATAKGIDWDKRLQKGRYELSIGNVENAVKIFSSEAKKHPEAGAPHTELGKALKRLGKTAAAKAEFLRATEVDPSYADGFYELGSLEEYAGEWALAATAFEHYLQLDTASPRRNAVSERLRNCKQRL